MWERDIEKEKALKKRYGKDVEVYSEIILNKDKTVKEARVKIKTKRDYILTDKMENNLTREALLTIGNNTYTYDRMLDAEIHAIDLIAEE